MSLDFYQFSREREREREIAVVLIVKFTLGYSIVNIKQSPHKIQQFERESQGEEREKDPTFVLSLEFYE